MGIFQLKRLQMEKAGINGLMNEVEDFVNGAGKLYESIRPSDAAAILGKSISMKILAGENLKREILEKAEKEKDVNSVALLKQLSLVVENELASLRRLSLNLSDYQAAQEENKVISQEEALRKLKMGVEKYAGKNRDK